MAPSYGFLLNFLLWNWKRPINFSVVYHLSIGKTRVVLSLSLSMGDVNRIMKLVWLQCLSFSELPVLRLQCRGYIMMSSYFRIYFFLKNKCKERGLDDYGLKAACFCFCSFVCDGILRCFRIVESWKVVDEKKSSWKIELSLLELAVLCCHGGALSRSARRPHESVHGRYTHCGMLSDACFWEVPSTTPNGKKNGWPCHRRKLVLYRWPC